MVLEWMTRRGFVKEHQKQGRTLSCLLKEGGVRQHMLHPPDHAHGDDGDLHALEEGGNFHLELGVRNTGTRADDMCRLHGLSGLLELVVISAGVQHAHGIGQHVQILVLVIRVDGRAWLEEGLHEKLWKAKTMTVEEDI